jgi:hypothetical protein
MLATAVLVLRDDSRWYLARLLGQHRDRTTGEWRCGVRYTVDVGMKYQRVVWADQRRRLTAEDEVQLGDHAEVRYEAPDYHDGAAPVQVWGRHEPRR